MSFRPHDHHRNFDITRLVLFGYSYRAVARFYGLDFEYVRSVVFRFCFRVNPYLFDELCGSRRNPDVEILRERALEFMPSLSGFDVDLWLSDKSSKFLLLAPCGGEVSVTPHFFPKFGTFHLRHTFFALAVLVAFFPDFDVDFGLYEKNNKQMTFEQQKVIGQVTRHLFVTGDTNHDSNALLRAKNLLALQFKSRPFYGFC